MSISVMPGYQSASDRHRSRRHGLRGEAWLDIASTIAIAFSRSLSPHAVPSRLGVYVLAALLLCEEELRTSRGFEPCEPWAHRLQLVANWPELRIPRC